MTDIRLPPNLDERYQNAFRRKLYRRQERRLAMAFAALALAILALMILHGGNIETQENAAVERSEQRAL
jgi:hypothetical protein